jgi:elongation factor G
MEVEIAIPTEATARVNGMIPQRRGQILGFDAREGWPGWDVVKAHMPESEMADLIVEPALGDGRRRPPTPEPSFHHLAELTGRSGAGQRAAEHKQAGGVAYSTRLPA